MQGEAVLVDGERLRGGAVRVDRGDKARLTEEEAQLTDLVKLGLKLLVGVDREVGGDNRQLSARLNVGLQEVANLAAIQIIADAGGQAMLACAVGGGAHPWASVT